MRCNPIKSIHGSRQNGYSKGYPFRYLRLNPTTKKNKINDVIIQGKMSNISDRTDDAKKKII